MTGLNHGLTGAVIALTIKQPALAIPLAFFSHFVVDAIPHWDYGTGHKNGKIGSARFNRFLISDFSLAIITMIVLSLLFPGHRWTIWLCMIAAASPDGFWGFYYYVKKTDWRDPLSRFHLWTEWSETPKGIFVEAVWLIAICLILINYH